MCAQFRNGKVGAKSRWNSKQNCPPTRLYSPETRVTREKWYNLHITAKDLASGKHNEIERSEDRRSHSADHEAADREKCCYFASSCYWQWNLETTYFFQVVPMRQTLLRDAMIVHRTCNPQCNSLSFLCTCTIYYKNMFYYPSKWITFKESYNVHVIMKQKSSLIISL